MAIQKISGVTIELDSQVSGDVTYFDGTDWVRLAKGEIGDVLTMNESETAPEWGEPVAIWTFPGTVKGYCASGNTNPSGAGATIKLYNGTSAVAASLVFQAKFGSAAGVGGLDCYIPQNGILCPDGIYAALSSCDSCTVVWQS